MGLLVAIPAAALLWVINKRLKGRGRNRWLKDCIALITLTIAMAVGAGLAYSFVGRWAATALIWTTGFAGNLAGVSLSKAVPLAFALIGVVWVVCDVAFDRVADKGAQAWTIVLPTLLALMVGGRMGATGGGAVQVFFDHAHSVVSQIGGV
jgi:hypothetical protein